MPLDAVCAAPAVIVFIVNEMKQCKHQNPCARMKRRRWYHEFICLLIIIANVNTKPTRWCPARGCHVLNHCQWKSDDSGALIYRRFAPLPRFFEFVLLCDLQQHFTKLWIFEASIDVVSSCTLQLVQVFNHKFSDPS